MANLRVMIVDSDVRVRRCLSDTIGDQLANFEVVAVTSSMPTAVARLEHSASDILIINFELLEAGSPQEIRQILQNWAGLKILSYRTALSGTLKKIETISLDSSRIQVVEASPEPLEIAAAVLKQLQKGRHHGLEKISPTQISCSVQTNPAPGKFQKRPRLVVIGVSTGGPNALAEVIPNLPASLAVPVLIVQHMPQAFIPPLAQRLNSISKIEVKVATDGELLKGSICRIAPGECHLEVKFTEVGVTASLTQGPPENSCKPAADVLFRSAAAACGAQVLGVVLTGMGRDGCAGSMEIVKQGGAVIVQDEATAVVWGMPGAVVEARAASEVLPLQQIADSIARRCVLNT